LQSGWFIVPLHRQRKRASGQRGHTGAVGNVKGESGLFAAELAAQRNHEQIRSGYDAAGEERWGAVDDVAQKLNEQLGKTALMTGAQFALRHIDESQ
jgi:hypothetical protein